jgi:hypothetical protein
MSESVTIEPEDQRMRRFTERMNRRLALFGAAPVVDDKLVKKMQAAVDRVRATAIEDGLRLPPLTVFALPAGRHVEVFRADAEPQAIGMTLAYLQRAYNASAEDLAWGLKRAYPNYAASQLH